jgi:hypothetical protein
MTPRSGDIFGEDHRDESGYWGASWKTARALRECPHFRIEFRGRFVLWLILLCAVRPILEASASKKFEGEEHGP